MKQYRRILPRLQEDERIYFSVPYMNRRFAKICHCGFDSEKKLWFTGSKNAHLTMLVRVYPIHEQTSEKARRLLEEALTR